MPRLLIASLLVSLVATAAATTPAAAADQAEEDQQWRDERRDLRTEHTDTRIQFVSERNSEQGDDRLEVYYERDTGQLEYRFMTFNAEGEGIRFVHQPRIVALVEFTGGDDGRWRPGARIVERYALEDLESEPLSSQPILQGGGYRASAHYTIDDRRGDDDGPLEQPPGLLEGRLTIELVMVDARRSVDGEPLAPTGLMWTVHVEDHPFTRDDTYLALETAIPEAPMQDPGLEETLFTRQTGPFESQLAWSPEASVNGVTTSATSTVLSYPEEDQETLVVTAYARGETIEHAWSMDTKRFTELPEEVLDAITRGDPLVFTAALAASLLLLGWPVTARLRHRPER